jgi:hypothetical protein
MYATFVISSYTAVYRTSIAQEPRFTHGFLDEYCFFRQVSLINPDDDNFMTRWLVTQDWEIAIWSDEEATIIMTLG